MKTLVVLQGGGPLGAFGCGAWMVLAPWLRARGHRLVAVAGASIGALNAAMIATNAERDDRGAAALHTLWRDEIAEPAPAWTLYAKPISWPWGTAREAEAWAGWSHGFFFGNRALFAPQFAHWTPMAGLRRAALPLYSQHRMWQLFGRIVGPGYRSEDGQAPALAVAATDVLDGSLRLFSSDVSPVDALMLSASAAIPLMFEPVAVEGRLYADGEMNGRSLLPLLVDSLLQTRRLAAGEPVQLISIGQFSRAAGRMPQTSHELLDHTLQLLLAGKLRTSDSAGFEVRIDIERDPEPQDGVSGQFDYSQARIERLIDAGRSAATLALERQLAPST